MMKLLLIAGVLTLTAAQTTIEPSILMEIFAPPKWITNALAQRTQKPLKDARVKQGRSNIDKSLLDLIFGTPTTPNRGGTSGPLEEGRSNIDKSVLDLIFGTPSTPNRGGSSGSLKEDRRTPKPVNFGSTSPKPHQGDRSGGSQATRLVNVEGVPTMDPSVFIEIFGTPPTTEPSKQREGVTPSTASANVKASTISPSVIDEIFGTPPTTAKSSRNGPESVTQSTASGNIKVSTLSPSVIDEIFGTPPTTAKSGPSRPTLDPLIEDIFGTPTTAKSSRNGLEDITVKPTDGTSTFVDNDGQSCQCVPYYLCDANKVGVDVNNASVTGWGTLDIRFGEDDDNARQCQESVEVCCAIPKDASEVPLPPNPPPQPDPKKVKGCGYRNPQGLGGVTVAGGSGAESQFGEFPWVIALLDKRNSSYVGVGVLIHPQVVMTGAHVVQKYRSSDLKIRAGEWDTQTNKEIYPYVEKDVKQTVIHDDFMPKSLKNDMALLLLDSPLEITEHINVLCMPDQEEVFDSSKNCVANGWGKKHFGQRNVYAVILKKVEQDMVPYSRCNALLKRTRLGHNFKLHDSFVCAGGEEGKDTCQGDGGAPLACPIGNNRYKLAGLVAWGIGCGQKDVPAVYVNVPKFRDWVDEKMANWGLQATSYRLDDSE